MLDLLLGAIGVTGVGLAINKMEKKKKEEEERKKHSYEYDENGNKLSNTGADF